MKGWRHHPANPDGPNPQNVPHVVMETIGFNFKLIKLESEREKGV